MGWLPLGLVATWPRQAPKPWSDPTTSRGGRTTSLVFLLSCTLSHFSPVRFFAISWTVVPQVPLSMGFPRQEYWRGLPSPPLEDLPDSGIEPAPLMSPALAGGFFTTSTTWEAHCITYSDAKSTVLAPESDPRFTSGFCEYSRVSGF